MGFYRRILTRNIKRLIKAKTIRMATKQDILDRSLDEELLEFNLDPVEQEEEVEDSVRSQSTGKRGRPAIPEKWTRVIRLADQDLDNIKTHIIATDLLLVQGYQGNRDEPQDAAA